MDISKNLTSLRKNRDLSRQELSDIIGISVHTYIKYENGSVKPPYETLCKLADYYKVKTDQILGREEMPDIEYDVAFESELIEQYKRLPKDVRALILQAILNAAKKCENQIVDSSVSFTNIVQTPAAKPEAAAREGKVPHLEDDAYWAKVDDQFPDTDPSEFNP